MTVCPGATGLGCHAYSLINSLWCCMCSPTCLEPAGPGIEQTLTPHPDSLSQPQGCVHLWGTATRDPDQEHPTSGPHIFILGAPAGVCSILMWGVHKCWTGWQVVPQKQPSANKGQKLAEECPAPSHLSVCVIERHGLLRVPWHQAPAAHRGIPPSVGFPHLQSHFPLPSVHFLGSPPNILLSLGPCLAGCCAGAQSPT